MILCFLVGLLLPVGEAHNPEVASRGWSLAIGVTLLGGAVLFGIGHQARHDSILRKDAIGIVGLAWLACGLFAALPYLLCEPHLSLADAFFESISGLTTTGSTVITQLGDLPKTVLLWRSATQWLGGIGILAMFVLVLSSLGASGLTLFRTETSAHGKDLAGATLQQMARWLWAFYIAITLVCALGMWALGMTPFQAINHAMTAVSTGGFGTEDSSFNDFGNGLKIWAILFMFLCGVSLPLYVTMMRKRSLRPLSQSEETWAYAAIMISVSLVVIGIRVLANNYTLSWFDDTVDTVFNIVSMMTSTGYAAGDYDQWPSASKGLILFVMIIGGCAGSTAGGLKVSRIILFLRMFRIEIGRVYRPNQVVVLKLNGHPVPEGARGQTFVILTAAGALMAFAGYMMLALEPDFSADACLSTVISCLSNTGPAFKEFGPTHNFAGLSLASKMFLPILMVVGRLEYLAVLALFSKNLWRRY